MTDEHKTRTRQETPPAYRWRLEDIYAGDDAWEMALGDIQPLLSAVTAQRGRLAAGSKILLETLTAADQLDIALMELLAYARMRRDEDNACTRYQSMTDRITGLYYETAAATAFISPEISAISAEQLLAWLDETPGLAPYRQMLYNLLRLRAHILPEEQEALLARFGPVAEGLDSTFTMLENVDLKLGAIADDQGGQIELTPAVFGQLREHRDRGVRARAFAQMHQAFADLGRTLASLYGTRVKADVMFAQVRHHPDSLRCALAADNLPTDLYASLIEAVHGGQSTLNCYLDLRRRRLGLDELHIYDTYVPILTLPERRYTYEEACALVSAGLTVLGPAYGDALGRHLSDRWIDVYETPGKTSGAYSWGTYRTHPYILLNFSGTLSDVFTLAHELGHSLHTAFSNRRPYAESHYPIFLAEIASTVNEILLMHNLLGACPNTDAGRQEKAYLLNHFLEEFRLTVFRQTMFAEFEWQAHQHAERGEALTADLLGCLYGDLLRQYFGPDLIIDPYMHWEWARIPHFYHAYYVYQYATGFAAAVALCRQILSEGAPAVARYLTFLGAGGSAYPLESLAAAGVDLATPDPVRAAMAEFADRLNELDQLLQEA
jgi:oligoendopeptidase F